MQTNPLHNIHKRFTQNINVHNIRNRHKMFYSLVETGWFRINCTKSRTLYNRVIGDCKKWSVNATIRCWFPAKAFDNSYLRILGSFETTLKRQIFKLQFKFVSFYIVWQILGISKIGVYMYTKKNLQQFLEVFQKIIQILEESPLKLSSQT